MERLWRSLKYEEVYLNPYDGPRAAPDGIGRYFTYFNEERPHQTLGCQTRMEVYLKSLAAQTKRAA